MKIFKNAALFVSTTLLTISAMAQIKKDILALDGGFKAHTTLLAVIKGADLVNTFKAEGYFTVFGTTNNTFAKLYACTLDNLLNQKNKPKLAGIRTYHVIAGKLNAKSILATIKKASGNEVSTTVAEGNFTGRVVKVKVELTYGKVRNTTATGTNFATSNVVIHVIDKSLLFKDLI